MFFTDKKWLVSQIICIFASMKLVISIFCIFILCFNQVKASEDNEKKTIVNEWKSGGAVHKGKIFNHSPLMAPLIKYPVVEGEIFISKQTYGNHRWNSFFNYPEYGLCLSFLDLGSPDYTGTAQCLYPYINFHLFNNRYRMNINFRFGAGFAYIEKIYNAKTNPLNYAFSTHPNILLNAQLQGVCKISKSWSFFAGGGINHFSNGAYRMPNLGMNIFNYFTGISHSFGKEQSLISSENKINLKNKKWDFSLFLLAGIKEINPVGGKTYFAGDFNMELTKKHLQYTRFGLSLDITHDGSEYDCIVFQSLPAVDRLKTTRIGLSGGYVLLFGDFSLDLYLGRYLYEPNPLYGKAYQRTSLRYPLSDRVKVSLAFRNHKGKADFVGIGLGFRLTK